MEAFALKHALEAVRDTQPLVHSITNYVTVNDCANVLLASGASPIMSDEPEDVTDITALCQALVINIGTLNKESIKAMYAAGGVSAKLGHPIVLDPVGAGASRLRTETAAGLLDRLPIAVVRGNMSEIKALALGASATRGVDVCPDDLVTPDNLYDSAAFACDFAKKSRGMVAITGAIDIVADETQAFALHNGDPIMGKITGTGCMLSCLCAAYLAAKPSLDALLAATAHMAIAGEVARRRMEGQDGTASFRTYLIDAVSLMTGDMMEERVRLERIR